MQAQNSSRDSQAKLMVRSVIKWLAFRGNKNNCDNSDLLCNTPANSKLVENRKKPVFKFICPDFWTDLNDCRQRLLFARQPTQWEWSLCLQGTRSLALEAEGKIRSNKKIQFFWFARLWTSDVSVVSCTCYGVCNSFFTKSSVLLK